MRIRIPYQGNCNVVCPEVEGEVEEDNLDAAAVEVLALRGHQGAKDRVKSEDWTITSPCSLFTARNLFTRDFKFPMDTCNKISPIFVLPKIWGPNLPISSTF